MAWFWHGNQCMSSGTLTEIIVKCRLKLSHPKNKPHVNIIQKCHWAKAMHWGKMGNTSVVRQIKMWTFFFLENMDAASSGLKCNWVVITTQLKIHLCIRACGPDSLHIWNQCWKANHPDLFSLCQIPVSYSLNGIQLWFSV